MPQPDAVSVLLINEHAEEVKLITTRLRSFYPGCHVEAVYSSDEALEWAAKHDWSLILFDEGLQAGSGLNLFQEIRRRAPRSAIILQVYRDDLTPVLQYMRQGADYCVLKASPVFVTELLLVTKEVLDKKDLRARLDFSRNRYQLLTEKLSGIAYDLDAEGRFLHVSSAVTSLLGYQPHELIGSHYSVLFHPEDTASADRRFNERRTGARATRQLKLRLVPKGRTGTVTVEINASALYDHHQQFLATVGIIQPLHRERDDLLQRLNTLSSLLRTIDASTQQALQTILGLLRTLDESAKNEDLPQGNPETGPNLPVAESNASVKPELAQHQPSFYTERRSVPRTEVLLEVQLRRNGTYWDGTALNIGLGGLYAAFKNPVSVLEGEEAQVELNSDVGVLDIRAFVLNVRNPRDAEQSEGHALTGIVFRFSNLSIQKEALLRSILDSLQMRTLSLTVNVILAPKPQTDQASVGEYEWATEKGTPKADRRLSTRVQLSIPLFIEIQSTHARSERREVYALNLSAGGAALQLPASDYLKGQHLRLTFPMMPPEHRSLEQKGSEPAIRAEVIWTRSGAEAAPKTEAHRGSFNIGIRFVEFEQDAQRRVGELMSRYLTSPQRLERSFKPFMLRSDLLSCTGDKGQRLVLYHDHLERPLPPGTPLIILMPDYGETKWHYLSFSYYFAANGFHVFRYDHRNHIGESEGGMVNTTLGGMQEDLNTVFDYVQRLCPASPTAIVAAGLSARVAFKALAEDCHADLLIALDPVVDLQSTLATVHHEDLLGAHLQGTRYGVANILGSNVDADRWLADAARRGYADLQATLKDVGKIKIPVILFSSERNPLVFQQSIKEVKMALREHVVDWHLMPQPYRDLSKHPDEAQKLFLSAVKACRMWFYRLTPGLEMAKPPVAEIERQSRLEQERSRAQHTMVKAEHIEFWQEYLDQSHYLVNFADYWHLMDHIYRLMGPLDGRERILDAGCGHGNFGMFLLIHESSRRQITAPGTFRYIGIDFVNSGLVQAKTNLLKVAAELRGKFSLQTGMKPVLNATLLQGDLDLRLPFQNDQFDRIVCNLVIAYLRDPLFTLRELVRVLAPGGKLIVTSLKPQADLSQIYRNFMTITEQHHDVEQAKQILKTSGRMVQHEREGSFRSFERQTLLTLLISSGAAQPRIYSSFANQAYVAVSEKS